MSDPKFSELIQCPKCKVPVDLVDGGLRCPSCGETTKNPKLESLLMESWPQVFCERCGKTQRIMPNNRCFICGNYPDPVCAQTAYIDSLAKRKVPKPKEKKRTVKSGTPLFDNKNNAIGLVVREEKGYLIVAQSLEQYNKFLGYGVIESVRIEAMKEAIQFAMDNCPTCKGKVGAYSLCPVCAQLQWAG